MASTDLETKPTAKDLSDNPLDTLADSVKKIAVQSEDDSESSEPSNGVARPFFSYTRPQIMHLYKSPLVQSPDGMPELKDWFGDWNEQYTSKKDPDTSATTAGGRDRRFRRDPEDTDSTTARPSFRTTLTQPSQMGNFRHQSTRTSDRDRDKDTDKEKDRDRDTKDGLRSLSDKYDRDRLGLTAGSGPLRPRERERDAAPHLATTATSRLAAQPTLAAGARRTTEPRESGKRRVVESSDDWRRGAEPPRRDEKSDTYRRDREARERPRSRSRTRRDASATRRDRDDKDRERPPRGIDHYSPTRDKDEDARRWRDDGKRDERLAGRRDRDRETEKDAPNDKSRDRDRWHTTEDRETRSKRPTAKDRRYADDGKDKDDHRDKDREREKEPAWMETYVPNDTHAGILGGQAAEGEMDSIQAWKKGMKEKEEKEKQSVVTEKKGDNQMDEIQLFKMLIKREADKKDGDPTPATSPLPPSDSLNGKQHPSATNTADSTKATLPPSRSTTTLPATEAPRSLLSLITTSATESASSPVRLSAPPMESQTSSGSRFFPKPLHGEKSANDHISPSSASDYLPPQSSRLLALGSRTPSGSIAHPSNAQAAGLTPRNASPGLLQPSLQQLQALHAQSDLQSHSPDMQYRVRAESPFGASQRAGPGRQQEQFSPFDHTGRGIPYDEKDLYPQQYDGRRASGVSNMSSDSGSYGDPNGGYMGNGGQQSSLDPSSGNQGGNFTNGKGSRFAKFFDNKGRDPQMSTIQKPGGIPSPSQLQGHRQEITRALMEQQGGDSRAMEDLFAMLQSSSQGPRINPSAQAQLNQMSMLAGNSYGQGLSMHQLSQHGGHMQPNGRLDALYDSRFEDKSFVPDGMVPGLRTAPPTRSREASNGYLPDHLDDQIPFAMNRPPPQHRNGEMFNNVPQVYPHQQGFVRNGPIQQAPYRGNPSPIPNQNPLQRLPPGLANLGGRPPHDSNQFFGNTLPLQSAPQSVHNNGPSPQSFNSYQTGGLPFAAAPQMRVPSGQGHMQNAIGHSPIGGLGHPNAIDIRAANQAQLLGLRGGGYTSQQLAHAQMQAQQQLGLRQQQQQQQQQHLPQNMVHHLPHHLQQPPGVPGGHNQPAQDLMALLMGNSGPHLE